MSAPSRSAVSHCRFTGRAADARPMGDPRALMGRLTAAQNAHDLEGMLACFHEDYRSEQPQFPARTFEGIGQVRATGPRCWTPFRTSTPRSRVQRSTVTSSSWRSTGREPRRTARRSTSVASSSWASATTASPGGASRSTNSNAKARTSMPSSVARQAPKTVSSDPPRHFLCRPALNEWVDAAAWRRRACTSPIPDRKLARSFVHMI